MLNSTVCSCNSNDDSNNKNKKKPQVNNISLGDLFFFFSERHAGAPKLLSSVLIWYYQLALVLLGAELALTARFYCSAEYKQFHTLTPDKTTLIMTEHRQKHKHCPNHKTDQTFFYLG